MKQIKLSLLKWIALFLIFSANFSVEVNGQSRDYTQPPILSTAAGAIGNGLSVDYYTGKINVNVPLGDAGEIFSSVGLTYSSGGFKPTTSSSVMGLGWNIQCAGAITRMLRGIPDEVTRVFKDEIDRKDRTHTVTAFDNYNRIEKFDPLKPNFQVGTTTPWEPDDHRLLEHMAANEYDTQHDIFSIAAPGLTAAFILKKSINDQADPEVEFLGSTRYQVTIEWEKGPIINSSLIGILGIKKFSVTAQDGSVYIFDVYSTATQTITSEVQGEYYTVCGSCPATIEQTGTTKNSFPEVRSSWQLRKIVLPNSKEVSYTYKEIKSSTISYSSTFISSPLLKSGNFSDYGPDFIYPKEVTTNYSFATTARILAPASIRTPVSEVIFDYTKSSLNKQGPDHVLTGIRFFGLGQLTKVVLFGYSSLCSNGDVVRAPDLNLFIASNERLVVTDLEIFDRNLSSRGKEYLTYYHAEGSTGFPSPGTRNLDFWGYYNGQSRDWKNPDDAFSKSGAVLNFARMGMLRSITTANGQTTEIEYGKNKSYEGWGGARYVCDAGGLRVENLTQTFPGGLLPPKVTYIEYGQSGAFAYLSSSDEAWKGGYACVPQKTLHGVPGDNDYFKISFARRHQLQYCGAKKDGSSEAFMNPILLNYSLIQLQAVDALEDPYGRSVVYTRIRITQPDGSKQLLEFSEPEYNIPNSFFLFNEGLLSMPRFSSPPTYSEVQAFSIWTLQHLAGNPPTDPHSEAVPYNSALAASFNVSHYNVSLPDEFYQFDQFSKRSPWFKMINPSKLEPRLLRSISYRRDGAILQDKLMNYTYIQGSKTISNVLIKGLVNYNFYKSSYLDESSWNNFIAQNFVEFIAPHINRLQYFLYSYFTEEFGYYVPSGSLTKTYDLHNASNPVEIMADDYIAYHTDLSADNIRLYGKKDYSWSRTFVSDPEGNLRPTVVRSRYRYPSQFLNTSERSQLSAYLATNVSNCTGSCDRHSLALARMMGDYFEEEPMEVITTRELPGENEYLIDAQLNLPYYWGDESNPRIGVKESYLFQLQKPLLIDKSTGWPATADFTPIDWSGNSFTIDSRYKKVSQVLEVNSNGQIISNQENYNQAKEGLPSGKLYGYASSAVLAEVAYARASECSYSSFEMPILNNADENGWIVYSLPDGEGTEPRCEVEESGAFSGGRCIRINNSFGPTVSIPIQELDRRDYIFEVWIKNAAISDELHSGNFTIGGYLHRGSDYSSVCDCYTYLEETAGNEWKKYSLVIPSAKAHPSGTNEDGELNLRVFVQSSKSLPGDLPDHSDLLVDECRLFPSDALMTSASVDLKTGSVTRVDAKGKKIRTSVKSDRVESYDVFGKLTGVSIYNYTK